VWIENKNFCNGKAKICDRKWKETLESIESAIITPDILARLREIYQLNWNGIHGCSHWMRVRTNGLRLAGLNGANPRIIEWFAFLHDIQRENDGADWFHGRRASELIRKTFYQWIDLTAAELDLLCQACAGHTGGIKHKDLTVRTCWDADRLDLYRVGTRPNPKYLCTQEARQKEIIAWAMHNSIVK